MTIREKLLVQLAKDPSYEGVDDTEKALVKELKAEMEAGDKGEPGKTGDSDIKAAASELAEVFKSAMADAMKAAKAQSPADRPAQTEPNSEVKAAFKAELDKKVKEMEEKGASEQDLKKFKKSYQFAEFVKALVNKDEARVKALAEGTPGDGGYLVPSEFKAQLIQDIYATKSFRQYATVIPVEGNLLNVPKLTADVAVYWGTENRTIATTSAEVGNMNFTPFRLNAIIYLSRELFDDSAISIMDTLRQRFTMRVADEEMKRFLNGNGTTQPKGLNTETFRSVSAANALTPKHLTTAYWKLPEYYRPTSTWIINSRVMEHLENQTDTVGQFLYPSLQGETKTLKGRPILVTDHQPSSKLTLGDLQYYWIADRQQVSMDFTTEAGNTWEKYQVGLRLVERVDGECALTNAFVQVTNTNIH